ncbi:hypothetical protein [Paenibacillus koleovorans]|uniref:hypothetical protein n=1 Tax=Paenibacillus koleovorans TaxID=121608 RepID=UPI000FD7308C|nr:hypothetical protein [Paenibacillus koleovorans]
MRKFGRQLALSAVRGAIELILFYPVLLLFSPIEGFQDQFHLWLLMMAVYMPLGTIARFALRFELRFLLILAGIVIVGGLTWLVFGLQLQSLISAAAGAFLFYHGFRSVRTPWHLLFPGGVYWVALFLYLLAALLLSRITEFKPYMDYMIWFGVAALLITVFLSNNSNLKGETQSGSDNVRLAPSVVWKNRVLIGITLLVIFGIGLIGVIRDLFLALRQQLVDLINRLLATSDEPPAPTPSPSPTPTSNGGMLPQADNEPSALMVFLDKLAMYAGRILALVLILAAIYFTGKAIVILTRKLIAWLRQREADSAGFREYEEEKTSLISWKEIRDQLRDQLSTAVSRFKRDPSWEQLEGGERIRLLYRLFLRRSVSTKGAVDEALQTHLTPQEQLALREDRLMQERQRQELADAYNAVRYGGAKPDPELPDRIKRETGL